MADGEVIPNRTPAGEEKHQLRAPLRPKSPAPLSKATSIAKAIRKRRVGLHPDRLKKRGLSKEEEEAIDEQVRLVGWAANIVEDPNKKGKWYPGETGWAVRGEQSKTRQFHKERNE
ncbi:hypothetical protein MMC21_008024 [Puttea exsequens]|nr:hypothetical protein [Puttea exsequens]